MTVSAEEAGEAFLASLTSRRLDLRSALGSYAIARHLPQYSFTVAEFLPHDGYTSISTHDCGICGGHDRDDEPQDLNIFSFERFKWDGVRRDNLRYITFDLEQFARAPRLPPTQADIDLAQRLVDYLRQLPIGTTAVQATPGLTTTYSAWQNGANCEQ